MDANDRSMEREKGKRTLAGSRNPPRHHHHPSSLPTDAHCYRLLRTRMVSRLLLGPSLDVVSYLLHSSLLFLCCVLGLRLTS